MIPPATAGGIRLVVIKRQGYDGLTPRAFSGPRVRLPRPLILSGWGVFFFFLLPPPDASATAPTTNPAAPRGPLPPIAATTRSARAEPAGARPNHRHLREAHARGRRLLRWNPSAAAYRSTAERRRALAPRSR